MQPSVIRPEPPITGDEPSVLTAWLEYHRSRELWKCDSLQSAQPVPPPSMTPLALMRPVRHMSYVERHWPAHNSDAELLRQQVDEPMGE